MHFQKSYRSHWFCLIKKDLVFKTGFSIFFIQGNVLLLKDEQSTKNLKKTLFLFNSTGKPTCIYIFKTNIITVF